jgi:hypothetical protein
MFGYPYVFMYSGMESELVDVLCMAETLARSNPPEGDEHLVNALLSIGVTGPTRKLLESNGVFLERLVPTAM